MTTTDPRTVEQIVGPIAARMGPCPVEYLVPGATGDIATSVLTSLLSHPNNCRCHGTGQVVEFEMLRKPCSGDVSLSQWTVLLRPQHGNPGNNEYIRSCACQGRGWLPVTTTDALLEAIRGLPGFKRVTITRVGAIIVLNGRVPSVLGTPNVALALALEAALPKEAHDVSC